VASAVRRRKRPKPSRADRLAEQHRWKLSLLRSFVKRRGWSELRADTVVPPGVNLFTWLHGRRQDYRNGEIADWLVKECEGVAGWSWDPIRDRHRRNVDNLRAFVRAHGWERLTLESEVDGVRLSAWAATRRIEYRRGALDRRLINALEAIPGWTWEPRTAGHSRNLLALCGHVTRHGWSGVNLATKSRNGLRIGTWANHMRVLHRQQKLPPWLEAALEAIAGWTWEPRLARQARKLELLRSFVAKHGWSEVNVRLVIRGVRVGSWLYNCRARHADGSLSAGTAAGLEALRGFRW
jgi:hypothetical protein